MAYMQFPYVSDVSKALCFNQIFLVVYVSTTKTQHVLFYTAANLMSVAPGYANHCMVLHSKQQSDIDSR